MEADSNADHIRHNIESTRAALDEKLDMLESKARETLDWKHQVNERPWVALGLALAAGYVVGSLGGDSDQDAQWDGHSSSHSSSHSSGHSSSHGAQSSGVRSAIDSELNMLKGAALGLLSSYARDALREYMPRLRETISSVAPSGHNGGAPSGSAVPSSAPNNSFAAAANSPGANSNEIPTELETRYGMPPAQTNSGSEYYDVASSRTGRPSQSEVDQTQHYNQ